VTGADDANERRQGKLAGMQARAAFSIRVNAAAPRVPFDVIRAVTCLATRDGIGTG